MKVWLCVCVLALAACGDDAKNTDAGSAGTSTIDAGGSGGMDAGGSGGMDAGGSGGTGGNDSMFERPDSGPYEPEDGTCGFDTPAFCDNFERGPAQADGRSGELDSQHWSGVRGGPWSPPDLGAGYAVGPARLPACRDDLPARTPASADALVCDPIAAIPTRHALITAASQNYGLTTYRIRQPFDFEGRTGTIKLDAELVNNGLGGWTAIAIGEDPSPAPSFDWEERGSGPRNGFSIEFSSGCSGTPGTVQASLFTFADYVQTSRKASGDCAMPHTTAERDHLNHVEIYLARDHVEVWASEASADGRAFANLHLLLAADLDLPFTRGYVSLIVRNHATLKYWAGSAALQRFDNVGFDGPVIDTTREHSAPDSLDPSTGLEGCMLDGGCVWPGDAIAMHPADDSVCPPEVSCSYDGPALDVGYVVPRADETPVSITIPQVDIDHVTRARLAIAATYPWFEWGEMFPPPTAINLRYSLNGGTWHDRFITATEASAFTDYFPELGGAGHGAGLLNQIIELDHRELRNGDNTLELQSDGTWTGEYRVGVLGIDLLLDTE